MKRILFVFGFLLLLFTVLALRPIYNLDEKDCVSAFGTVEWIGEGGPADIVFKLKEDGRRFYINRGEEAGLRIDSLRKELVDQKISLKYADHWTPLDPKGNVRHIAELSFKGEVLYSEIQG